MLSSAYEITTRTSAPYSSISYIQVVYPDGTAARASGVVVGPNDVLTALHVVYQPDHGGWAVSVDVVPGADTSPWSAPYGQFTDFGTLVGAAPNWDLNGDGLLTQPESAGDLALIGMKSRIGDVAGVAPVAQVTGSFESLLVGFPAAATGMMAEAIQATASTDAGVYTVGDSLGAGASGGPILEMIGSTLSVVGVLSSGASDGNASTYAGLFTSETWTWLQNAMAANDYLIGGMPVTSTGHGGSSYVGTAGADNWTGTSGWDRFAGGGGNDVFDGGPGIDTAVFSGLRSSYGVSVAAAGTITVADSVAARDGTDTLFNTERVQFSDSGLAFDASGDAGEAYRLYQAAFNRAPDLPGMGYQMHALDNGLAIPQLAGNFLASPEFQATYGSLTDAQYVTQLYRNVLHRDPSQPEVTYHVNDIEVNGATRADVLVHFSDSTENQAALIGVMQLGMPYIG